MSINHFSSEFPEPIWWNKQQQYIIDSTRQISSPKQSQFYHHPTTMFCKENTSASAFNLNNSNNKEEEEEEIEEQLTEEREQKDEGEGEGEEIIPKEHLFEKPLTPSDVGKLNRLVIPKQHAEKYFPVSGNNNNNNNNINESGEKGVLLSFEDELGKSWRFRYSYWNSSQSYVLTKGWSRFVKEKRLDAGDIVLFERHRLDRDRLFIGWRRRNTTSASAVAAATAVQESAAIARQGMVVGRGGGGGGGWAQMYYSGSAGHTYPAAGLPYQPDCLHAGNELMQKQTTASSVSNPRRQVRLFGVNLECEADESSWSEPPPDGSSTSSHLFQHQDQGQGQAGQHYYQYQYQFSRPHVAVPTATSSYNNNHHNHMGVNYSRDVSQMRYHQG